MRRMTYLKGVLTVNAVLLAGVLWTQVVQQPVFSTEAQAQVRSRPNAEKRSTGRFVDAGTQRAQIVDSVEELSREMAAFKTMLQSGNVRVQVTNLDEIRIDVPSSD